ncbi:MAG: penicillin-binding protein 2 [Alphaproteobacteria bacterium]
MSKNTDKQKVFTRRAFVIGGIQAALLGVMGGRLAWLQVAEGGKYQTLADKNRINIKLLAPSRGEIYDRNGLTLATNTQNFRVLLIPEQTDDLEQSLQSLGGIIDLNDIHVKRALKKASKVAKFIPVEVKDDLSWEEVSKIEVNLPDLPGLSIDVGERRHYPGGESCAHVTGYVRSVTESEIKEDKMLSLPGFKTGKTGLEKKFDVALRGQAGTSRMEVNVIGRQVRELSKEDAQDGQSIVTSIDKELQDFTFKRLSTEKSASGVVMDVHTGAVYACASSPAFDPNIFTRELPAERWEALLSNPGHPLTNKAVAGQYPPGSTFKMVTALAALEAGVIDKNTSFFCPGFYELGKDRFHCWKRSGHGRMNLISSLAESCDVYYYKIAVETGIEQIATMARKLGLGQGFDFDLPEERPGLVPDKDWKRGYFGKTWQPGETIVASIGQGYLLATPLQLAVMTARLVNGGKLVEPWMSLANPVYAKAQKQSWEILNVKQNNLDLVQRAMDAVVNSRHGTAAGSRIIQAGMEMGGKTGTSQVKRITRAQRLAGVKNEDLPWKSRHHALFVGYAPIEKPRYVASVIVEHGVSGSGTAAPIAKDLLIKAQEIGPSKKPIKGLLSEARSSEGKQAGGRNG